MNIKLSVLLLLFLNTAYSEENHSDHNHSKNEETHEKHDHDNHKGDKSSHVKKGSTHKPHDGHSDDEHAHKEEGDHDDHGHGGGKAVGKGKAIVEIDEVKGFKLSKEAIKTLKLKLNTVEGSIFDIDKKTLVASKNVKGVYRFRAGFFKLLPAKIIKEGPKGYKVEVAGVDFGDQIVVNGLGLLRVTDVYSTDKSEYGHSH